MVRQREYQHPRIPKGLRCRPARAQLFLGGLMPGRRVSSSGNSEAPLSGKSHSRNALRNSEFRGWEKADRFDGQTTLPARSCQRPNGVHTCVRGSASRRGIPRNAGTWPC
ncbi:hypothetical protein MTO96_014575 [Rhipicephalus appendiculatus]